MKLRGTEADKERRREQRKRNERRGKKSKY